MTCTIFQSIGSHVILQNIIVFVQINEFEWIIALVSLLIYSIKPRHGFTHHSWLLCSGLMLETGLKWSQVKLNSSQTHETIFIRPDLLSLSMWPHTEWQQRYTAHLWTWSRASFLHWSLLDGLITDLRSDKYTHQQTPQVSTTKLTRIIIFPTVKQKIRPWTRTSHIRRKQRLDNVFVEQNKLFSDYRFSATALMFGCIWRERN